MSNPFRIFELYTDFRHQINFRHFMQTFLASNKTELPNKASIKTTGANTKKGACFSYHMWCSK